MMNQRDTLTFGAAPLLTCAQYRVMPRGDYRLTT
jgi:hypothetical protein